jgi:oxygen-independent coproporphyrinogen-3 oxidase
VLKYVESVESGSLPVVEEQILTEGDIKAEGLFLGLRLMRGVSLNLFAEHAMELERFREAGLVEQNEETVRLTRQGALLSNEVFSAFV